MPASFQFSVPVDARYRVLAPEVAAKYAALAGCGDDEARAVLDAVAAAATDLATAGRDIALHFDADASEVIVTLSCGARTATVRHPIAGAK